MTNIHFENECNRSIKRLIIHCTASIFGDVTAIRQWHLARGFEDCGYHYVILNGHREPFGIFDKTCDGLVEVGRPWWRCGAHTKGHNDDSLGICLVGSPTAITTPEDWFTPAQLETLATVIARLAQQFAITADNIHGHNEYAPKICPGFVVANYRNLWL